MPVTQPRPEQNNGSGQTPAMMKSKPACDELADYWKSPASEMANLDGWRACASDSRSA